MIVDHRKMKRLCTILLIAYCSEEDNCKVATNLEFEDRKSALPINKENNSLAKLIFYSQLFYHFSYLIDLASNPLACDLC
jgi:hypothetical protein